MTARDAAQSAADVLVASPRFLTAPLYRHWHLRWGATDAEVALAMPGDEIVPEPSFNVTRALTIDAPPERVGALDRPDRHRAGRLLQLRPVRQWRAAQRRPHPAGAAGTQVDDWVPMSSRVSETTAFRVKAFERDRWLLWAKPHSTWAWTLTPLEGGRTRLVTRLKESTTGARRGWPC
jgi:hypothetical protein